MLLFVSLSLMRDGKKLMQRDKQLVMIIVQKFMLLFK